MNKFNLSKETASVLQCQMMKTYYKGSNGVMVFFKKLHITKDSYIMEKIELTAKFVESLTNTAIASTGENGRTRVWRFAESDLDTKIRGNIDKDYNVMYVDEINGRE